MKSENIAPKNLFAQKGKVKVIKGSILMPENAGLRFILNIVNTAGKTDSNPLYPLFDKKWRKVKEDAKGWWANKTGAYKLGAVNQTAVNSDVWVIHMLCQNDDGTVDASGLKACLTKVCAQAKYEKATVHISTLLTSQIPEFAGLLNSELIENGVSVNLYEEK